MIISSLNARTSLKVRWIGKWWGASRRPIIQKNESICSVGKTYMISYWVGPVYVTVTTTINTIHQNLIADMEALDKDRNECRRKYEDLYNDLTKDLRDQNGNILEYAKGLQDELDKLRKNI